MSASSRGLAVVSLLACMASLPSVGAELRPYTLPSQQSEPRMEQRPIERRAVRPWVNEAYYQNFEKRVKGLKPAQRNDLARSFAQKRDQAIDAGRVDEAQHYLRLLQILREAK